MTTNLHRKSRISTVGVHKKEADTPIGMSAVIFPGHATRWARPVRELSELGTSGNKSLAGLVVLVLLEVLDEACCEVLGLNFPFCGIGVGVAGIKNRGINTGKFGGNLEVKDGELLGRSCEDGTVEDGVDDTAGVADRDTLAGSVPAGVYQISLGAALLHLLDKFLGILGRMQFEECLAEASRESRSRLCDTAFCTCELGGEA